MMPNPIKLPSRRRVGRSLGALVLVVSLLPVALQAQQRSVGQASQPSFSQWLQVFKQEAVNRGFPRSFLDNAFAGIQESQRVIELDRKQPESRLTFAAYRKRVLSDKRANQGQALMRRHAALLERTSRRYGVQPRFIVALWGIETSYGANTGGFPILGALATLAWEGRRATYFRKELYNALTILREGHIQPGVMKGSWAGAMGQSQFMPSSFLRFAVDANGDGRKDIWNSLPDIFASIANYLSNTGWKADQTWGRAVRLPRNIPRDLIGSKSRSSMARWRQLGVKKANGENLPARNLKGSIIQPDGAGSQAFLVYGNFRRLLQWNRSNYFATSVGLLSDRFR